MNNTKYNNNMPLLAQGYARQGLSDIQIIKNLGITKTTFYKWLDKKNHLFKKEFSDLLKKGKKPVVFEVENALFKRALGYEYTERKMVTLTTPEALRDAASRGVALSETNPVVLRIENTIKHIAPDVAAAFIILKNKDPENWKDKHEFQVNKEIKHVKLVLVKATPDESK